LRPPRKAGRDLVDILATVGQGTMQETCQMPMERLAPGGAHA
jgi:hypothetical protein